MPDPRLGRSASRSLPSGPSGFCQDAAGFTVHFLLLEPRSWPSAAAASVRLCLSSAHATPRGQSKHRTLGFFPALAPEVSAPGWLVPSTHGRAGFGNNLGGVKGGLKLYFRGPQPQPCYLGRVSGVSLGWPRAAAFCREASSDFGSHEKRVRSCPGQQLAEANRDRVQQKFLFSTMARETELLLAASVPLPQRLASEVTSGALLGDMICNDRVYWRLPLRGFLPCSSRIREQDAKCWFAHCGTWLLFCVCGLCDRERSGINYP